MGGAIFGSAVYLGEMFCGNVAYVTILKGASWRWPVVACGVAVTSVSASVALLIREPPVGRFINQKKVHALHGGSPNALRAIVSDVGSPHAQL